MSRKRTLLSAEFGVRNAECWTAKSEIRSSKFEILPQLTNDNDAALARAMEEVVNCVAIVVFITRSVGKLSQRLRGVLGIISEMEKSRYGWTNREDVG
jgi:hypothetical protein